MPKSKDSFKELQRLLGRLARLDGLLVATTRGPCLVQPEAVLDPRPLLESFQVHGAPTLEALSQSLRHKTPPQPLTLRSLAVAQRDLSILEKAPALWTLPQEAPRLFRGYERLDQRWLRERRARLERLSQELGRARTNTGQVPGSVGNEPPWFPALLDLISTLHGEESARRIQTLLRRSAALGQGQRRGAQERLEKLQRRLEGASFSCEPKEFEEKLESAVARARAADRLPGRAKRKKLAQLVWELIFWPKAPPGPPPPAATHLEEPGADLLRLLQLLFQHSINNLRSTRSPEHLARLYQAVSCYGLLFPSRAEGRRGALRGLERPEINQALRHLPLAISELAGLSLSLEHVLGLWRLFPEKDLVPWKVKKLGIWLAEGLEWELLEEVASLGSLPALLKLDGATPSARSYCRWLLQLLPHYRTLGLSLDLNPESFASLQKTGDEELAILGRCLIDYHAGRSLASQERQLATLDATLALFRRLPEQAKSCLSILSQTSVGMGKQHFPSFAAWLEDEPLLDRYLHLRQLLGEPVAIARSLLRDFERKKRREGERCYLASLTQPDERQKLLLARLNHPEESAPSPLWTQRRLEERIDDLFQRAFRLKLEEILLGVLQHVFGIQLSRLTPAWRDAVRFYLSTDDNHDLLRTLLQKAAQRPGEYFVSQLPRNREWLARVPSSVNLSAWLASRRHPLEIEGKHYTLSLEEDPLLVLRMGIPFRTCLSLEDGVNAAATVLNALDVNKRVLYLRDKEGSVVARKLIAISQEYQMIGYRLYFALEPEKKEAVAVAFLRFCRELSEECGLVLASRGEPEMIHSGFWYDDGVEPFGGAAEPEVQEYLTHLGLPLPRELPEVLLDEAAGWQAQIRGDVERAISLMEPWRKRLSNAELERWVVEELGETEALRRIPREDKLAPALLRRVGERSPEEMLALLGRLGRLHTVDDAYLWLRAYPPSASLGFALARAAARSLTVSKGFSDHGLEHGTMYELHCYAARMSPAEIFTLCEIIEPVWDWVVEQEASCDLCREGAVLHLLEVSHRVYEQNPSPQVVLACLKNRRSGWLALRVALSLAGAFPLNPIPKERISLLGSLERGAVLCAPALRILQDLRKRKPALERSPDLLSALLRQGFTLRDEKNWERLPIPHEPPFEALRDLQMHLPGLSSFLTRWAKPPVPVKDWRPGPWELYYHRRHSSLSRSVPEGVDRDLLRDAFALLARTLGENAPLEGREVEQALEVLWKAPLGLFDWLSLLEQLLERPEPGPLVERYLRQVLEKKVGYRHFELPLERLLSFWQKEDRRPAVLAALRSIQDDWPALYQQLWRIAKEKDLPCEDLFPAWLEELLHHAPSHAFCDVAERGLLEELFAVALTRAPFAIWSKLYHELPDAASAALFLQKLQELPNLPREELSSWLEQTEGRYPQEKLNLFWMRELFARHGATDGEASIDG